MKVPFVACATAWLIACTSSVQAASSVDMTVTGVITPSACTPTLAQGGVADYGKIAAKDLKPTTSTTLPRIYLNMQVSCEAATLFAFNGIDNRAGSAYGVYGYGLGMINDTQRLGGFWLTFTDTLADGLQLTKLASYNNGATWIDNSEEAIWMQGRLAAFGSNTDGIWAPVAIKELTSQLRVSPSIAPANQLTLIEEQPIDGSATLELRYL